MFKKFTELTTEKQNWLYYGVFMTVFAVPLAILLDLIIGFRMEQIKLNWLPNMLLANFAVAVNLRSLWEGKKISQPEKQQSAYSKLINIAMLISIILYFAFYSRYESVPCHMVAILILITVLSVVAYIKAGLTIIDITAGTEVKN